MNELPDNINTLSVCGAGTMGAGIAVVAALSGSPTILYDLDESVLQRSEASIKKTIATLVERNKITVEQKNLALQLITFTNKISDCKADLLIEAIIEKKEAKVSLFQQLMELNTAKSIYATNTSSLSVSGIAEQLPFPELVVGMHFFNPPHLMKLVEVVEGEKTETLVVSKLISYTKQLGKTPVLCKDAPGFIVNRVARHYYLEALRIAEAGYADIETIDAILHAAGFPMGPFRLMDLIGNDINLAVTESLYHAFEKEERFKPSSIQIKKVAAGELGKKTGKGYYDYS